MIDPFPTVFSSDGHGTESYYPPKVRVPSYGDGPSDTSSEV